MQVSARAHTNIALIKYWGKADPDLIIPANSSISMTLDQFYTDTSVEFTPDLRADSFSLDGEEQSGPALAKITKFMDLIRSRAGITSKARIQSVNHVPTAAGLASSASAYAALALAATRAAGLKLDHKELSRIARRGSGSASRSVDGGFVIWHRGDSDASSFAEPLPVAPALNLRMLAVVLDHAPKKISSRHGMADMVATSPFFPAWAQSSEQAAGQMQAALLAGDFARIGALAERNALMMHATNMAADPPFTYFSPETLAVLEEVHALRAQGVPVYATIDAGPNVKLICPAAWAAKLADEFARKSGKRVVTCAPGPAARILTEKEANADA